MGITGVNHVTFSVRAVEPSFDFYCRVLGFRPVAKWPKGGYLLAGSTWIALVQDDAVRDGPLPEYSHVAFTVSAEAFEAVSRRIREAGAPIWQSNRSEGASLYFLDPNGIRLEACCQPKARDKPRVIGSVQQTRHEARQELETIAPAWAEATIAAGGFT